MAQAVPFDFEIARLTFTDAIPDAKDKLIKKLRAETKALFQQTVDQHNELITIDRKYENLLVSHRVLAQTRDEILADNAQLEGAYRLAVQDNRALTALRNSLQAENSRLKRDFNEAIAQLQSELKVAQQIAESLRRENDDISAIAMKMVGVTPSDQSETSDLASLLATAPKTCTICQEDGTYEDVQPGSYGDFHNSCMAEQIAYDETRTERAA